MMMITTTINRPQSSEANHCLKRKREEEKKESWAFLFADFWL